MRNLIDAIKLTESIDIHPSTLEVIDGHTYINFPEGSSERKEIDCQACDGDDDDCFYCGPPHSHAKGKEMTTVYNFPGLNVSNGNIGTIAEMLGLPNEEHCWIEPSKIPEMRRRLILLKNKSSDHLTRPVTSSQHVGKSTDGNVTKIERGPTMIDGGMPSWRIAQYIDSLLEIFDWAQKHNCGVSWA